MDSQLSFFDLTDRYSRLSKKGDPLERLDEVIDWKEFDDILAYVKKKSREERECHSNAGRKSFGSRTLLKVLVLKHLYNHSFEQEEYQLKDRLSFMRFVGVGLNGTVPDENTVRNYFEQYKQTGAWDKLLMACRSSFILSQRIRPCALYRCCRNFQHCKVAHAIPKFSRQVLYRFP